MNPRKAKGEKVKNAGISLEPKLIQRAKAYAKKIQLGGISTLVRLLLVRELQVQEIAQWMEQGRRGPSIGFTPPPKMPSKPKEKSPEQNPGLLIDPPYTPVAGGLCCPRQKISAPFNRPSPN